MASASMRTFGSFSKPRAPVSTPTDAFSPMASSGVEASGHLVQGQDTGLNGQKLTRSLDQPTFRESSARAVRFPPIEEPTPWLLIAQCGGHDSSCFLHSPNSDLIPSVQQLRSCGLIRVRMTPPRPDHFRAWERFLRHFNRRAAHLQNGARIRCSTGATERSCPCTTPRHSQI